MAHSSQKLRFCYLGGGMLYPTFSPTLGLGVGWVKKQERFLQNLSGPKDGVTSSSVQVISRNASESAVVSSEAFKWKRVLYVPRGSNFINVWA